MKLFAIAVILGAIILVLLLFVGLLVYSIFGDDDE